MNINGPECHCRMRIVNNQLYREVNQVKYTCPCCGYRTLDSKHEYDICPICFWEDDWRQVDNPYRGGGANRVSLYKAQINFRKYGACEKEMLSNVRKPTDEVFDDEWRELPGSTLKEISEVFRFGLMIGHFRLEDVLQWVDLQIANADAPNIYLTEISFVGSKGVNEVISKLADVVGEQDIRKPAQIILGLINQELSLCRSSLDTITYRLYSLSNILTEHNVDKAILSELRVMDDYHHIYSQEEIRDRVQQLLEKYEDIAEQFTSQVDY